MVISADALCVAKMELSPARSHEDTTRTGIMNIQIGTAGCQVTAKGADPYRPCPIGRKSRKRKEKERGAGGEEGDRGLGTGGSAVTC